MSTPTARPFKYIPPDASTAKNRHIVWLARTDRLIANVQVVKRGGENALHSHKHLDGFWMVLEGSARFYGEDDVVLAELKKYEGILLPRGAKYWFENANEDQPLELLQVEAFDIALPTKEDIFQDRTTHGDRQEDVTDLSQTDGEEIHQMTVLSPESAT